MLSLAQARMIVVTLIFFCVFGVIKSQIFDLECIPLRDCPELFNLVNKEQPISQRAVNILKSSHCGFTGNHPKVWCTIVKKNECQTSRGEPGKCMSFTNCKALFRVALSPTRRSWNTVHYLQKSQCRDSNGKNDPFSICCPYEKASIIDRETYTNTPTPPALNLPIPLSPDLPKPSDGRCGQQLLNKIVGGKVTEMDEFPWTALLQYQSGSKIRTACSGSLISNRYVVTAAHCVDNTAVKLVGKLTNVILGEFDTRTETDCLNILGVKDCADPPLRIPIEEIIVYPEWYKRPEAEINHDIALVRLAQNVRFTNYIQPICLPSPTLNIKEESLVVTGWGKTENGTSSFVKLKTTLLMANRYTCTEKYKLDKRLTVGDGEMCVGGEQGKDSCLGDSGGPLMLSINGDGYNSWFLVGIVSFGANQPCGVKDFPGLYTNVPKYVNWIHETVRS